MLLHGFRVRVFRVGAAVDMERKERRRKMANRDLLASIFVCNVVFIELELLYYIRENFMLYEFLVN